ncbi:hypothetical protein [Sphingobacterium chuzhouense]|uniref:Lipocalin-like domain-containing protein n=1 Tax=Sphingobacterium chuzhouense TaxID=1742264 RepID=A0ABR7XTC6_9SPHI|nr:hypothetical protein [Sphingobacterium chuzhouense]MBD1422412.1 hypothetical protein [Sphingobacterium chuzhouense]
MNKHFRYSDWASKFVCTILLCLLFTFSRSQGKELQGKWVLDITLEEDGNSVSVRHPMFSAYLVYEFKDTQLFINDKPLSVTYMESNTIKTPYQTLHYTLDSIYLFVREQNENVTLAFLREEDFLNHNPVFRSKTVIRDGKEVIVKNDLPISDLTMSWN